MKAPLLEQIVEAVLYEGYVLYPYRASSKKNRRERFTFGRVYPEAFSAAQKNAEPCLMQTQCLLATSDPKATVDIRVGFLHPLARQIGLLKSPQAYWDPKQEPPFTIVPELRIDAELYQSWLEAVERKIELPPLRISPWPEPVIHFPFSFAGSRTVEPIRGPGQEIPGLIVRQQKVVTGDVEVTLEKLNPQLSRITVRITNTTSASQEDLACDEEVILRTFASTHTILHCQGAEFVSLMDPPSEQHLEAQACKNIGTWPVLVGDADRAERQTMLSSPIILYDYPKLAPESAGALFDGTEIDEILTLRILTLTEQEKLEMRHVDEQARRLLERTEALPADALLKMHGTMRDVRRVLSTPEAGSIEFDDFFGAQARVEGVWVGGVYLRAGDRVRLRPNVRADAIDLALAGEVAVIEAIEQDLEKRIHLAVVLEKDPGKDLGFLRQPGHRFFYGVDEVEPLPVAAGSGVET
jgi:hypothetical protein